MVAPKDDLTAAAVAGWKDALVTQRMTMASDGVYEIDADGTAAIVVNYFDLLEAPSGARQGPLSAFLMDYGSRVDKLKRDEDARRPGKAIGDLNLGVRYTDAGPKLVFYRTAVHPF